MRHYLKARTSRSVSIDVIRPLAPVSVSSDIPDQPPLSSTSYNITTGTLESTVFEPTRKRPVEAEETSDKGNDMKLKIDRWMDGWMELRMDWRKRSTCGFGEH